jgi:hypothetical protein
MRRENDESNGQQVFRHLQAITAWHAAIISLLNKKYQRVAHWQSLRVGLVEVTPSKSDDLMTDEEVIKEFFRRQPQAASSPEARTSIEIIIRENNPKKFTGTTHAEATLMGLLTYLSPGSSSVNYDDDQIEEASLRFLKELIEPVCYLFIYF